MGQMECAQQEEKRRHDRIVKAFSTALQAALSDQARRLLSRMQNIWAAWLDAHATISGSQANVEQRCAGFIL